MIDFTDSDGYRSGDEKRFTGRPFVGVLFECCNVYARIYRRLNQAEYIGRCPSCLAEVRLKVGPGGTAQRIFRAG